MPIEISLHVSRIDAMRFFPIELAMDLGDRRRCGLPPVLHHHPYHCRTATVLVLADKWDIKPQTAADHGGLGEEQSCANDHFTAIKTTTAVPRAIRIYVIC